MRGFHFLISKESKKSKDSSETLEVIKGDPNRSTSAPIHAVDHAFSKKLENHAAAVALHFVWYNFVPRLTSHVWSIAELVSLLDVADKKRRKDTPFLVS